MIFFLFAGGRPVQTCSKQSREEQELFSLIFRDVTCEIVLQSWTA